MHKLRVWSCLVVIFLVYQYVFIKKKKKKNPYSSVVIFHVKILSSFMNITACIFFEQLLGVLKLLGILIVKLNIKIWGYLNYSQCKILR